MVTLVASLVVLGSFFAITKSAQAGLGYSPGTVIIDGMSPNTSVAKQVTFSRDEVDKEIDLMITFVGIGSEYLSGSDVVHFDVGQTQAVYQFTVSVGSVPTGTYESLIYAITKGPEKAVSADVSGKSSSQSTITLAAYPKVIFSVTNEILQAFTIKSVNIQPTEEQQPLGFTFFLMNTGNVAARPTKIDFSIVNQDIPDITHTESISGDLIQLIKAFTSSDVSMFTKAELPAGKYFADFVFWNNDDVIFEQHDVSLQIFPPGTLEQKGILNSFLMEKTALEENELTQFTAEFQNTGTIGLSALFVVDINKKDERFDILKTEPVFVPPGKTAQFSLDKRFAESGEYVARGYVSYGIYNSDAIELTFKVGGLDILYVVGVLVILSILILLLILLIRRKKRLSNLKNPPNNPTSTTNTNLNINSPDNN